MDGGVLTLPHVHLPAPQAMAEAAADGYGVAASQTLASALAASPQFADALGVAVASAGASAPGNALANSFAQATAAALTRDASDAAAGAIHMVAAAGGSFAEDYIAALASTGTSAALCAAVGAAEVGCRATVGWRRASGMHVRMCSAGRLCQR